MDGRGPEARNAAGEESLLERRPSWPGGHRCAAAITFDVDVDSMLRLVHGARAPERAAALSWLCYDHVALPRLLRIFREREVRQTFFFPAWCMERYPDLVEAVAADGHEVGLHGYMHEVSWEQDAAGEEEILERGLAITERILGAPPAGWRAPLYGFSDRSAELLAARGFLYDASLMGDDVPYLLRTPAGDLVELPSEWANDDWTQYAHSPDLDYMMQVRAPGRASEVYTAELDAAYAHGGLWVSVWHPNVSGRLARVAQVIELLDDLVAREDVWLAPLSEIATHVRRCVEDGSYEPRVVEVERATQAAPSDGTG
jgi:peptidoglycan/xylan/chitin deacetylase (PgdA/CDA1 family)